MLHGKDSDQDNKKQVVEQRIKPTVIRRRAQVSESKSDENLHSQEAPSIEVQSPSPDGKESVTETVSDKNIDESIEQKTAQPKTVVSDVSEAERKIGVVGYINLGSTTSTSTTTTPVVKIKEDWQERLKKGPKRKKSKAELEMEAIQRAGGLRKYAGSVDDDTSYRGAETPPVVEEEAAAAVVSERVFQPVPSLRRKKSQRREFKKTQVTEPKAIKKVIRVEDGISVSALSQALGVKANEILQKLMALEIMVTINQQIDVDTATLIAGEYGFTVEHTAFKEEDVLVEPEAKVSVDNLLSRAPIVTVMGHVDHGKTSILDVIRKANVAEGEAGGITQHIGAYEVTLPKGKLTFLDTPGHEAFTTMRARGAQVTDIVILVVAADDGIMPQTIEAIDHAKAAGVPIVVAVNKIDKANAEPDRVKKQLTEHGLVTEEWGGDVICVPTSAKNKTGIDQLLEMVLLQAEVLELKADPTIRPKGTVIEARLDRGRGPVATVLVQEGTLKVGSFVVCGAVEGKVRAMFDASGHQITEAGPSKPVEILGLSETPSAGDEMVGVVDERSARLVVEQRVMKERSNQLTKQVHMSLESLSLQMSESDRKELGVILKADVQGSLEAVSDALLKLSNEKVKLTILHSGVGGIIESDVMLASASDAVVFGFGVTADNKAKEVAMREGIDVRSYRIIYEMIDEVRNAMEGLLSPIEKEVWLGRAEVRNVFKISKTGTIAGCHVVSGKIQRSAKVRLLRDNVIVFDGKISSLKRFKDDAREVLEGFECGIGIENYNDIKLGDVIEAYIIEKTAAKM